MKITPSSAAKVIHDKDGFECFMEPTPLQRLIARREGLDIDRFKWLIESMESKPEFKPYLMAGLGNFRPTTRDILPTGIGVLQADLIIDNLLPTFYGGANEEASYPTFGIERFYTEDSTLAVQAMAKRRDIAVTWTKVTLNVHALEAVTELREQTAASGQGIDVSLYKAQVLRDEISTEKEVEGKTLLTTTGNYASGHSESLSGANKWSDFTTPSDPVNAVFTKRELVRTKIRKYPDTFWMAADVFNKLSIHPKIQALSAIAYTGATGRVAVPVDPTFLAALFRMSIVVGFGGVTTSPTATTVGDIWTSCAGLLAVGGNEPITARYGLNVSSTGYPASLDYRDERVGPKGADVTKVSDAWKSTKMLDTAGYLWLTVL